MLGRSPIKKSTLSKGKCVDPGSKEGGEKGDSGRSQGWVSDCSKCSALDAAWSSVCRLSAALGLTPGLSEASPRAFSLEQGSGLRGKELEPA